MVLTFIAGAAFTAQAADSQPPKEGIGISPTSIDVKGDPGQELKGRFTVVNQGTEPLRYKIYASDFRIKNEAYEKDFEPSPNTPSPVSWIRLPAGPQVLAGGKQAVFDYTIQIPPSAISRGYYGVIFAETLPAQADATGVLRVKRVGTLLYLGVNGGLVEKGSVASYQVNRWQQQQPVNAQLHLINDGNIHLETKGEVQLKNIFGKTVSRDNIQGTLLPATTRKFNLELPSSFPLGIYKVEGSMAYGKKPINLPSRWVILLPPVYLVLVLILVVALLVWGISRRHGRGNK